MIAGNPWLTTIVLTLALVLGIGAVNLAADAIAPGAQPERYEKAWCKEPGGTLEACAIRITTP